MKIVYHLAPEEMPADFKEQLRWLIENGDAKADEMLTAMNETAGSKGHAKLLEVHIEVVQKLAFGALPYSAAQLCVTAELEETQP